MIKKLNGRELYVKRIVYIAVLGVFLFYMAGGMLKFGLARAAAPGDVVINEVAWAGSADSSNDEWIELYNTTGAAVDLSGWTISDDNGASVYALSGSIAPHGYFLIEDSEPVVNPNAADLIVNLSLANTGDSLVLYDALSQEIDAVNSTGGAWFAGGAAAFASMERVDALVSGDSAVNWVDSDGSGSTATASGGSLIVGTPGLPNSASGVPAQTASVNFSLSSPTPTVGDQLVVDVRVSDAADLFSYGMEIDYDPAVLSYVSVTQTGFLNEGGAVSTSFQYGLENGNEGKLLVAEARMIDPKTGVDGSGLLFTMVFDVIGGEGIESVLSFNTGSFISDTSGIAAADFVDSGFIPEAAYLDPATNLQVIEAAQRYSIQMSWDPPAGAASYRVLRMDPHGDYVVLGETASTLFVDSDALAEGGNIVPDNTYLYRVVALNGTVESAAVDATGMETRGLKGDNNRSDRVDGLDLDNLARHFAEDDSDVNFDALVDTTYDGIVDGGDLIDLGISFALTYSP